MKKKTQEQVKPYRDLLIQGKPYYPLTFFNEDSFKGMLEDLYYGNRLEIVLNDIKDTEIVKSGAIRDIVLKELGDNFFFMEMDGLPILS